MNEADYADEWQAEIARLRAQNAELLEALKEIAKITYSYEGDFALVHFTELERARSVIRRAEEGK
jgi:hypothetical protein